MSYTFEYGNDFNYLKEILMNRSNQDYPYQMDAHFDYNYNAGYQLHALSNEEKFTLFAKDISGNIVATYAARRLDFEVYANNFKNHALSIGGTYHNPAVPEGVHWYSSCQWVHSDHRNQGLGITMDRMKKDKIWELRGDINYANCREALKDYHISPDGLGYDIAQPQAFIPSGGVGGAGSDSDKNYFLVYEILS